MFLVRVFAASFLAAALTAAVAAQPAPAATAPDPELAARIAAADPVAGEGLAGACLGCHTIAPDGADLVGPNLYDIVGAPIARRGRFAYSPAFQALGASGATWTVDLLDAFLASPFTTVLGTRMGFTGIADPTARANVIAWLRLQSPTPIALAGAALPPDPTRPAFDGRQSSMGGLYYGYVGCGDCHGPTLGGTATGTPLRGPEFEARWNGRSLWEFYSLINRTMPRNGPGGTETEQLLQIIAMILEANGFAPGPDPIRADRAQLESQRFAF
jgi:cytochrome c